jgi:predicted nicotinamide N-methyase
MESFNRLPETPLEVLGPTVRESVTVGTQTFIVSRPDAVDRLTDHPVLGGTGAADEYMPYWAQLWAGARLLADIALREPWSENDRPTAALEIGCGLGLPGLAALARGLHVTFSDYDATALRFAADNARINGFSRFDVLAMDWRRPPEGLSFPLLLAADLIYEAALVAPLAALIRRVLAPGGCCLLVNGDRVALQALPAALAAEQLTFGRESVPDSSAWLFRIRHLVNPRDAAAAE